MKTMKFALALSVVGAGAAALAQGQAPGRITTPEGAQMSAATDLAYKPGQLTQQQLMASMADQFRQKSANVFRRYPRDKTAQMVKFYTGALALRSLSPIQLTATQQMLLTGVGSGQIKLSAGQSGNRKYNLAGGYNAGTGIRYFRLTYPDPRAVQQRFAAAGFPVPQFTPQGDGTFAALVEDPGGFQIELVIGPSIIINECRACRDPYRVVSDVKDGSNDGVGVGIGVSDLKRSRAFYREFVGLDELPPVKDKLLGLTLYPYRRGETTLYLYKPKGHAVDNGSAGIQYVIADAPLADARGKARHIAVETPLNKLAGFNLVTVWLNDPDGVTNYFAQVNRSVQPASNGAPGS